MEMCSLIHMKADLRAETKYKSSQRQDGGSRGWITSTIQSPMNFITVLHRGHDLLSFSCSL